MQSTIISCESDRATRWIKEAVKIRLRKSQGVMNRDEVPTS